MRPTAQRMSMEGQRPVSSRRLWGLQQWGHASRPPPRTGRGLLPERLCSEPAAHFFLVKVVQASPHLLEWFSGSGAEMPGDFRGFPGMPLDCLIAP